MGDHVPIDELAQNLAEYKEQLAQVEALLLEYPDNEEYQELYTNLKEVITLTEDVQRTAGNAEAPVEAPAEAPASAATPPTQTADGGLITAPPTLQLPSVLPPQVKEHSGGGVLRRRSGTPRHYIYIYICVCVCIYTYTGCTANPGCTAKGGILGSGACCMGNWG